MTTERGPLSAVWQSIVAPDADGLRELARVAAAEPQRVVLPPRTRRLRKRWALGLAACTVLVASALGFGLGAWLTPSGDAGRNVVGLGFLPQRGWSVVQTAGPGPGATTAVARRKGIVVSITSTPRGDPSEDVLYPIREMPLRIADALPSRVDSRGLELRAGVGGYNIDARIRFSSASPSPAMVAVAQGQLDRLVVAADRVTIAVRPAVSVVGVFVTAFGTIDSGRAGESVTIQAKDCGNTFFRVFAGASTEAGGSWSTLITPQIKTVLRAVWNGETSNEATVRVQVFLQLRQLSPTRFRVGPTGYGSRFIGKLVTIQRFDQRLGRWQKVKVVKAGETDFGTKFTLRVPKGTRIRALFPTSQAGPCYVGGTSPVVRT